ncbi:class I SAM-dependent methyltransferase [Aurantiacibacter sp. D1-12]|uniref:class I SAM-dependent methyltransferase n=1 Tax=Aurantiacibacter sp. D1-12 TaxID=2993658 RepID=UPI00237C6747|nr:class I SAM-dependent methyltransferase [Aurantiacibacter sp. D1-12]MDE1468419.1 class I SAM-dependent methyltransferase [Aurantiacibacter sp. D1-12]
MAEKSEWQGTVGESWADEYRRTDRSFTLLTEHLLAQTRQFSFKNVLDIGCGAGELSLAVARGRPDVAVTGVDVSPDLVAVARERGSGLANCSFELADAADWQGDGSPELLISRHGVMFFDDPPAAFGHLADQSSDEAAILFSCFRSLEENPFFTEVIRQLPELPDKGDPRAPGPFAFADADYVRSILAKAGWQDVGCEPFDFPMIAGVGEDPVAEAIAYFKRIGPAARAARDMDTLARDRFFGRIRAMAERNMHEGVVSLPAAAWIVTARKA